MATDDAAAEVPEPGSVPPSVLLGVSRGVAASALLLLGDRLGLWSTFAGLCGFTGSKDGTLDVGDTAGAGGGGSGGGKFTAAQVAEAVGVDARMTLELLRGAAARGLVRFEDDGGGDAGPGGWFWMTAAQAAVLGDEMHLAFAGSHGHLLSNAVPLMDRHVEALRTGRGLTYDEQGSFLNLQISRGHHNWMVHGLVPSLSSVDGLVEKLTAGAKVLELGCGGAWGLITMAKAFPKSQFHGYDISADALEQAARNIKSEGLSNVFVHNESEEGHQMPRDGSFAFAWSHDVLHDISKPAPIMKAVFESLSPDGCWVVGEPGTLSSHSDNIRNNPAAALLYGFSTTLCLSSAMSDPVSDNPCIGTLGFTEDVATSWFSEAGFKSIKIHTRSAFQRDSTRFWEARVSEMPEAWSAAEGDDGYGFGEEVDAIAGIVWQDYSGLATATLILLGDRLGMWERMRDSTPVSAADFAADMGLNQRLCTELLRGVAAAGFLGYEDGDTYTCSTAQATALCNILPAPMWVLTRVFSLMDKHVEAFKSGVGLSYDDQGPLVADSIARMHRPWISTKMATTVNLILPESVPAGGKVAEIGSGCGDGLVALAAAFPECEIHGYDASTIALARAKETVDAAGVSDRVHLHNVAEGDVLPDEPTYDLVWSYDVVHDVTHPKELIEAVVRALKPGCRWLAMEPLQQDSHVENLAIVDSVIGYAFSTTLCLSASMCEKGTEGPMWGTIGMFPAVVDRYFKECGFESVDKESRPEFGAANPIWVALKPSA